MTYVPKCVRTFGDHIHQSPTLTVRNVSYSARTALKTTGRHTHYNQALAIYARLHILSQRIQSPFWFLWKKPDPYWTLETLAGTPLQYRQGNGISPTFYSTTDRLTKNQPQILMSFIFFFLLFSEGLAKPYLNLLVDKLKCDLVLADLVDCTVDSLSSLIC